MYWGVFTRIIISWSCLKVCTNLTIFENSFCAVFIYYLLSSRRFLLFSASAIYLRLTRCPAFIVLALWILAFPYFPLIESIALSSFFMRSLRSSTRNDICSKPSLSISVRESPMSLSGVPSHDSAINAFAVSYTTSVTSVASASFFWWDLFLKSILFEKLLASSLTGSIAKTLLFSSR